MTEGPKLKIVLQPPGSNLCGPAVVATLHGVGLEEGVRMVGKRGLTGSRHLSKAIWEAGVFECDETLHRVSPDWEPVEEACIVRIRWEGVWKSHYVLYHHGFWYDPSFGILTRFATHGNGRITSRMRVWKARTPSPSF